MIGLIRALGLVLASATTALACGPDTNCVLGDRYYRIAMPEGHDGATSVGAIVFAHGYRGTPQAVMKIKSLRNLASELGVALIAPKARRADWDIPNGPGDVESNGSAELSFFDAMLVDAAKRHPIDLNRVMATGFSAGGMMVWNLACARSDQFAGFAPIAGTFWLKPPKSCDRPVANIIHIHGDNDRTVPLDGREIGPTRQGKVLDALTMYTAFGRFGDPEPMTYGDLKCQEQKNRKGDMLAFCLFEGGHSYRTRYVRFAWEKFAEAGRL